MSNTSVCMFTSTKAMPYVYMLTHRTTGQFYIGYREANSIPADQDLPKYGTSSKHVAAIGISAFDYQIIAEFFSGEDAYDFEQALIREHRYDPLILNRHFLTATDGKLRYIRPKGAYKATAETRAKLSAAHKGRTLSPETREKLSAALTGRGFSESHRRHIGLANEGRQHTAETKAKLSAVQIGKKREPFSEQWKANISAGHKKRDRSKEVKKGNVCIVNGQEFISVSEAARQLGHSRQYIRKLIMSSQTAPTYD